MNRYWIALALLIQIGMANAALGQRYKHKHGPNTPLDSSLLVDYYLSAQVLAENNRYLEKRLQEQLLSLEEKAVCEPIIREISAAQATWKQVQKTAWDGMGILYNWAEPSSPYKINTSIHSPFTETEVEALVKGLQQLEQRQLNALAKMWKMKQVAGTIFANAATKTAELERLQQQLATLHRGIHHVDAREWSASDFNKRPDFILNLLYHKVENEALLKQLVVVDYLTKQLSKLPLIAAPTSLQIVANQQRYLIGEDRTLRIQTFPSTKNNITIKVNGQQVSSDHGIANYKKKMQKIGQQQDVVEATCTDAQTGNLITLREVVPYEVYQPNLVVANDRMNFLYLGVENRVSIGYNLGNSAPLLVETTCKPYGENTEETTTGVLLENYGTNHYKITPTKMARVTIVLKDTSNHPSKAYRMAFSVLRVPDPTFEMSRKRRGTMVAAELAASRKITAWVQDRRFDYAIRPTINHYKLTHQSGDKIDTYYHDKAEFSEAIKAATKSARVGDVFTFSEISCLYPYDEQERTGNDIRITIK
jgi:hypothetical protein